jgi:uncharacterized membrane protein YeaQ/YmgE (transglycosylase-associated protein family)
VVDRTRTTWSWVGGRSVGLVSLLAWAVIGLIAGAVGQRVAGTDKRGCLGTMFIGVLGAFIGGGLYRLLRGPDAEILDEFDWLSILVAILGSVGLLLVLQALGGSGGRSRRR